MPRNQSTPPPEDSGNKAPILVPPDRLSAPALEQLLEEFVTRSGTDYGETECSLAKKKQDVRTQLDSGKAVIVFDPETQTCDIVLRRDLPASSTAQGSSV